MSYYETPPEGPGLVSPCCGANYEEIISISMELELGEDPITDYICEKCKDSFDYPEEEYEYDERMKENAAEDRMDEERLES